MDDLQFGAHDKLGSHILSLVRRQLPEDWTERYNTTPVLIETFAETERFTGAVYKASAWPNFCRQSPAGIRTSSNESADDTLTQIETNHFDESSGERENSTNPMPKGCHCGRTTDRRGKRAEKRSGEYG